MAEPTDRSRFLLTVVAALWAVAFGYAFVAAATAPSEAAGRPDGLNPPFVYLGWQGIAGIVSVAVYALSRHWPKGNSVRRLGSIPLGIALLHALGVAGFWLWFETL